MNAKEPLSARQLEVAALVADGKSNREIASALFLSERTVESHIAAIIAKFGVRSRTAVVAAMLGTESEPSRHRAPKTNLPVALTQLIGRETEVAEISAAVADSRVVTLTGTGGIGKTRTAIQNAERLAGAYSDGVWFVELAPLTDATLVAATIAQVLNVAETAGRPVLDALIAFMRGKTLLIVLDNCEHVLEEAARVADRIVRACPQVRILATSRESLKIAGERTYRLPSLTVPETTLGLGATQATAYGSVGLFVERARANNRLFELDDDNAPVVADICRRLDGLPLAIELAAARVKTLSVKTLLAKLDQRLHVLTSGERTALPRQQTLRALMDWSYDLLSKEERQLFERLAIFAGAATLESVIAVCADEGQDEIEMLDLLSALVDKSLVVVAFDAQEARYSLLESSREYAREKLGARGEFARVARSHASAFLVLAERLEAQWDTLSQRVWCARAAPEAANWRAALTWTLESRGDVALGQRLTGAMRFFFANYGLAEGRAWTRRALSTVEAGADAALVAKLQIAEASFALANGESERALAIAEGTLAFYRTIADEFGIASASYVCGRALVNLAQFDRADALLDEGLRGARLIGNRRLLGHMLSALAYLRSKQGDTVTARALYAEELELRNATDAESDAMYAASNLAELDFQCGDARAALGHASAALARARELEETDLLVVLLANTAAYLIELGDYARARGLAREALDRAHEAQLEMVVACAMQHLAAVSALHDPSDDRASRLAARLIGFVDARLDALGAGRAPTEVHEREVLLAALERLLGRAPLEPLLAAGAMLTPDEALGVARSI